MLQIGQKAPSFECIDENGVIIDAIGKVDTKNHTSQIL